MSMTSLIRQALGHREFRLALLMAGLALLGAWLEHPAPTTIAKGCLLGVSVWIVLEYVFHRFVLHLPSPPPSAPSWLHHLHHRLHFGHHLDPGRPELLFVPWWASPGLVALAYGLGALVGAGRTCAAAYTVCLVVYETMHFSAHVHYRPSSAYGRWMKRQHLLHHFKNEHHWYGVTNPLADWIAGTGGDADEIPRSGTAKPRDGESGW